MLYTSQVLITHTPTDCACRVLLVYCAALCRVVLCWCDITQTWTMILEFNDSPEGLVVDVEVIAGGCRTSVCVLCVSCVRCVGAFMCVCRTVCVRGRIAFMGLCPWERHAQQGSGCSASLNIYCTLSACLAVLRSVSACLVV